MQACFSTSTSPPDARKRLWQRAVSQTYFPLELIFRSAADFDGALEAWTLGSIAISRNRCNGVLYRRHERHLRHEREESFLVTVPEVTEIRFVQDGKDVLCRPGQFLIERSHLPYEFSHSERAAQWVLKIPSDVFRARIARPERLATLRFDASRSVGGLFVDMLRMTAPRLAEMEQAERAMAGRHLVDLLGMAIEADQHVMTGRSSSVRNAHLHRAERFIGERLSDCRLSPKEVAEGCGISLRYLHELFEAEGTTVCAHIRMQRLLMCEAALKDPKCRKTISEIAYDRGFGDQAQFSRSYRARFGRTPSQARAAARLAAAAQMIEEQAAKQSAHILGRTAFSDIV